MNYYGECIKNTELFKSDNNYIQSGKTDIALLLPTMVDWIDAKIIESGYIWKLVHRQY